MLRLTFSSRSFETFLDERNGFFGDYIYAFGWSKIFVFICFVFCGFSSPIVKEELILT